MLLAAALDPFSNKNKAILVCLLKHAKFSGVQPSIFSCSNATGCALYVNRASTPSKKPLSHATWRAVAPVELRWLTSHAGFLTRYSTTFTCSFWTATARGLINLPLPDLAPSTFMDAAPCSTSQRTISISPDSHAQCSGVKSVCDGEGESWLTL